MMVGNQSSSVYEEKNSLPVLSSHEVFFRKAGNCKKELRAFLKCALHIKAQERKLKVHNSIRSFLSIEFFAEEIVPNLLTLTLQRRRDHS